MERSAELMHTKVTDLMQVHNLRDLDTHMGTIREMKSEGLIRFDGITDYRASALDDLEAAMRRFRPDFIQINYSLLESQAELRLLPAARDLGVSVLVNRPFVAGRLFSAVSGHPMPDWATHYADSWAQFFLKWIVAHPAVTCVIPATSKSRHMHDNVMAGFGELPDANMRKKMKNFIMDL